MNIETSSGRQLSSLTSNGYPLEINRARLGWLAPSNPRWPIAHLREQFEVQGYLWLKGILGAKAVLEFRRRYFEAMRPTGLLAPDSPAVEGIYSGGGEDFEAVHRTLNQVVRWPEYQDFCLSAPLVKFYEAFFDDKVHLHQRKLIRHNKPDDPHCTGSHYDLTYLRAGSDRLASSWIPLGDVPVEMGGLLYLEGSETIGRKLEAEFQTATAALPPEKRRSAYQSPGDTGWFSLDLAKVAREYKTRWLMANYEAGDMVVHSPYILHASTTNQSTTGRMRLSTDLRYQPATENLDPRWNNHWSSDDGL